MRFIANLECSHVLQKAKTLQALSELHGCVRPLFGIEPQHEPQAVLAGELGDLVDGKPRKPIRRVGLGANGFGGVRPVKTIEPKGVEADGAESQRVAEHVSGPRVDVHPTGAPAKLPQQHVRSVHVVEIDANERRGPRHAGLPWVDRRR